jgi:2-haloacid dehalogenase
MGRRRQGQLLLRLDVINWSIHGESIAWVCFNHVQKPFKTAVRADLTIDDLGAYLPFSELTRASFRHATAEAGIAISPDEEERIMDAYNRLETFPEVDAAMHTLTETPSLDPWIFSNGTISMITSSLKSSRTLSEAAGIFPSSKVVSVDSVQIFKPHKRTYEHLIETVGMEAHPARVWLVTSNPFDVVGAVAAGIKSVWVDRGSGWVDGLGGVLGIKPSLVVKGVDEAIREISRINSSG